MLFIICNGLTVLGLFRVIQNKIVG